MLAVQLIVSSTASFAQSDNAAAGNASADKTTAGPSAADKADNTTAGKAAAGKAAADKAPAVQSETDKAVDQPITAVRVKGNHRIDEAVITQVLHVKPGERLDPEKVDADVRAVFKLGHFSNVQAQIEHVEGGVVLEYLVQEKPVVREVKIEGAKEISADKVRDAVELKPNSIYSPKDLQKSIQKVKKLYADDGFYLAQVEASTSRRSPTELQVTLHITEGKKILIQKIQLDGNKALSDKKLKKAMQTSEKWFLSWLTGAGTYKEEVLKNDVAIIADTYMNNGYVNVKVGEPKVELLPDQSGLKVTIGITEGEQYKIGKLGLKGELLESESVLMGKLKEKSGDVFSRNNLRTDVFALTDFYADKGYAFANAAPLTKLNPDTRTMDITFDMEKKELVHIDRINITGNPKTRDKVVRRELRLDEGDLYNATALKRSKQNLMNTGFFEEANLVTAKGSAPDKLDLNVEVKEKPTGTFSIGAGYSSLDGVIGQGSVQQANFLGLGLKVSAAASLGSKSQTYSLGVTDPYFMDSKWTLGGDIYRNDRDYLDYTRRATGGDIKAGYPISDNLSTFWIYKYETKEIFNQSGALLDGIKKGTIVAPERNSSTSSIEGSITRNTTDYRLDPSTGMVNTASIEVAGLGGSNRFVRYSTEHTYFYPLFWGGVASARGILGYIHGIGKEVPIDEKFYLGGIGSLRGYSARTVCPNRSIPTASQDYNGNITNDVTRVYLGGKTEAIVNLEYTFPLIKEAGLKGVVFYDAGNSDNSFGSTFSNIRTSYGAGVRWFSPIGPLRLEYGIPINPRSGIDNKGGKLEFSIGSIF